MNLAPIVLFTYNRPQHTQRSIEALQRNEFASGSELFIYSDGAKIYPGNDQKTDEDEEKVLRVREYAKTVKGFRKVNVIQRNENLGLSESIISGVTEIVDKYGKIIVLEDDILTSPYFLKFVNEALVLYEDNLNVISICGYLSLINNKHFETFFFRIPDCWGWATWKRGWDLFEPDGEKLYSQLTSGNLINEFDLNGAYPFAKMLQDYNNGLNDSWAIRWYASAFLHGKLSLYPGRSLVNNCGNEGSGRHGDTSVIYDTELSLRPVQLKKIPIAENKQLREEIERFFVNLSYKAALQRGEIFRIKNFLKLAFAKIKVGSKNKDSA